MPTVSSFLSSARETLLSGPAGIENQTMVLGNSSADLDSFISSILYAYCYARSESTSRTRPSHLPLLNLSDTRSGELWRLRPEFGVAMRLAAASGKESSRGIANPEDNKSLLKELTTIADIRSSEKSPMKTLFSENATSTDSAPSKPTKVVLVDHNALTVPSFTTDILASRMHFVGCIDHHVDESFMPAEAEPRIITTGVGSCTSLVVQHLLKKDLWPKSDAEVSKLALAPILIDTANLKAKNKVSETDTEAVTLLESCIPAEQHWNRNAFYDAIAKSKADSLELLTLYEILERDYKDWTERTTDGTQLKIGIATVVKPISWLISKSDGPRNVVKQLVNFSLNTEHKLSLLGIMAASTSDNGQFQRELIVIAFTKPATRALGAFKVKGKKEFKLEAWQDGHELSKSMDELLGQIGVQGYVWRQLDVGKSRKQVAPFLREMVKQS